jgi:hypothetical protein
MAAEVKERALGLAKELYPDFGPTLAAEKLGEVHDLVVSTAYLYERSTDGSSRSTGRPILKDKRLG